jgi:hypothetical protein
MPFLNSLFDSFNYFDKVFCWFPFFFRLLCSAYIRAFYEGTTKSSFARRPTKSSHSFSFLSCDWRSIQKSTRITHGICAVIDVLCFLCGVSLALVVSLWNILLTGSPDSAMFHLSLPSVWCFTSFHIFSSLLLHAC